MCFCHREVEEATRPSKSNVGPSSACCAGQIADDKDAVNQRPPVASKDGPPSVARTMPLVWRVGGSLKTTSTPVSSLYVVQQLSLSRNRVSPARAEHP
jgi:hypothetical protein